MSGSSVSKVCPALRSTRIIYRNEQLRANYGTGGMRVLKSRTIKEPTCPRNCLPCGICGEFVFQSTRAKKDITCITSNCNHHILQFCGTLLWSCTLRSPCRSPSRHVARCYLASPIRRFGRKPPPSSSSSSSSTRVECSGSKQAIAPHPSP